MHLCKHKISNAMLHLVGMPCLIELLCLMEMSHLVEMPHLISHGNNYFHGKLGNLTRKILHVSMRVHAWKNEVIIELYHIITFYWIVFQFNTYELYWLFSIQIEIHIGLYQ